MAGDIKGPVGRQKSNSTADISVRSLAIGHGRPAPRFTALFNYAAHTVGTEPAPSSRFKPS
jgi:hypothetical protein